MTDVAAFDGKEGHKDVADSAPDKGTEAVAQAGLTIQFHVLEMGKVPGLVLGGAQVSEKHTNFLLNLGEATAADIEALGEEVRERVKVASGVTLEWEIQRVGKP